MIQLRFICSLVFHLAFITMVSTIVVFTLTFARVRITHITYRSIFKAITKFTAHCRITPIAWFTSLATTTFCISPVCGKTIYLKIITSNSLVTKEDRTQPCVVCKSNSKQYFFFIQNTSKTFFLMVSNYLWYTKFLIFLQIFFTKLWFM